MNLPVKVEVLMSAESEETKRSNVTCTFLLFVRFQFNMEIHSTVTNREMGTWVI